MKPSVVNIDENGNRSILIIYTGGTFGMELDEEYGSLIPFSFENVLQKIPELNLLDISISQVSLLEPIDSSNVSIEIWIDIANLVKDNYDKFDGFVILHGTDTMAYTASMLSFILSGLAKPVIFTGAITPIGFVRSDARNNLISSLEVASASQNAVPIVREVCIFFDWILLRGNRSIKFKSSHYDSFTSNNYPHLAKVGTHIEFNFPALLEPSEEIRFDLITKIDPNVALLKLFPSMTRSFFESIIFNNTIKGIVVESFGSGNMMQENWLLKGLEKVISEGKIILNVSQCLDGEVLQGRYATSKKLIDIGVLNGRDLTTESAICKLMLLLGAESDVETIKKRLLIPFSGEMDDY